MARYRASTSGRTPRGEPANGRTKRFGADAAVVVVRVDLDGCLDLLNPRWQAQLRDADFEFVLDCVAQEEPIPVNTESGNHARDAADDQLVLRSVGRTRHANRSVRAVFEEGEPIFEASKIRSKSHVQIAVGTSRLSWRSRRLHGEDRRSRGTVQGHRRRAPTCQRRSQRRAPAARGSGTGAAARAQGPLRCSERAGGLSMTSGSS